MEGFYLNEYSFSLFLLMVLTLVLLLYLVFIREKEESTLYLIGFYFFVFLLFTAGFIGISLPLSRGLVFILLQYLFGPWSLVFLLLFVYSFQGNLLKRERRIVITASVTATTIISGYILWGVLTVKELTGPQVAWIAIVAGLEFLWALSVMFRKSLILSGLKLKPSNLFKIMVRPPTMEAKRTLIFAYLLFIPVLMTLSIYASYMEILDKDIHNFIFTEGSALFFFLFVLLYLNYSGIPTSLVDKIAGISLVSLILVLNAIGLFLLRENKNYYERINKLQAMVCQEKILAGKLDSLPEGVSYVIRWKASQQPFSDFELVYSSPGWNDVGFLVKDNIIKLTEGKKLSFSPMCEIERDYVDSLHREPKYFAYCFKAGSYVYEVGISSLPWRRNLHQLVFKFTLLIFMLFLAVIFVFPHFFSYNIIVPVRNLLDGARQIEKGDLDVNLPVRVMDEFGILSRAFNKMASSLRKYRGEILEYSKTLEEKVAERTRDLEEKNKMLLEMKKELERAARTDPLTGLFNRRALYEFLDHEVKRVRRNNRLFSIILCDIDNFKNINDSYGHDCGDFILKEVGKLFKNSLRAVDRVGRWGGEEFLIILPETALKDAILVAEKLRRAVASASFVYEDHRIQVTITFGVSCFTPDRELAECLRDADEALYLGKSSGKNRVVFK